MDDKPEDVILTLARRKTRVEGLAEKSLLEHKAWSPEWGRIALPYCALRAELGMCLLMVMQVAANVDVSMTEVARATSNAQQASEDFLKAVPEGSAEAGIRGDHIAAVVEHLRKRRSKREMRLCAELLPLKSLRELLGRY